MDEKQIIYHLKMLNYNLMLFKRTKIIAIKIHCKFFFIFLQCTENIAAFKHKVLILSTFVQ